MKKNPGYGFIERFSLSPHVEGGFYRRVYESLQKIEIEGKPPRAVMTAIYYLLMGRDFSTFHRLDVSEIWHYYQGNTPLILHVFDPQGKYRKVILSPAHEFQHPIPAQSWFAAELVEKTDLNYVLVGCSVAPEFMFEYLEMGDRTALCREFPEHADLIRSLTREAQEPCLQN